VTSMSHGPIKAIIGRNVNLDGNIKIDNGAGSIVLNNVADCNITIGSATSAIKNCALTFGQIDTLKLNSGTPIRNLLATKWLNGSLDAPWILTMTIRGDFGANINLDGTDSPKGMTLKKATIAGTVTTDYTDADNAGWKIHDGNCGIISIASMGVGTTIDIDGSVGAFKVTGNNKAGLPATLAGDLYFGSVKTITADTISTCNILTDGELVGLIPDINNVIVKGWITDSAINSSGNIGAIRAGAVRNCLLTANETIGRAEIKGIRKEAFGYINSTIEAEHIGTAYIGYPKYSNSGTTFGLTANPIDMLTIKDSASTQKWKNLDDPNETMTIQDFKITVK
jgi:hypothetical protein